MTKAQAKHVLQWILFIAAILAAAYIGFVANGLGVAERIVLAASSLGGLFVALGKIFPALNSAIDALPLDDQAAPAQRDTTPKP